MTEQATLGIDVSKRRFDVALLRGGRIKNKHFNNEPKGYEALLSWLSVNKVDSVHVCMEATGVYGEALATHLYDAGLLVSVVNPARIKGFASSELLRTKTDRLDAGVIARFCAAVTPAPWQPLPRSVRELRALVRRLEALLEMRQQERNRLEAAEGVVAQQLARHLLYLEEQIGETRRLIDRHIDDHPDLKRQRELLLSIPGVGEATVRVVLGELANVVQFDTAKALAAFIGVAPRSSQSGSSIRTRGRMSKMGRARLRAAFYMPALVALRHNSVLVEFKARLRGRGKASKAITGAAMRKLVHIIYGVLKSGRPFDAKLAAPA